MFSDTISEKIKRDHVSRQPAGLRQDRAIRSAARRRDRAAAPRPRRARGAAAQELADELAAAPRPTIAQPQMGALNDEIAKLDAPEQELRRELRQAEDKIMSYARGHERRGARAAHQSCQQRAGRCRPALPVCAPAEGSLRGAANRRCSNELSQLRDKPRGADRAAAAPCGGRRRRGGSGARRRADGDGTRSWPGSRPRAGS